MNLYQLRYFVTLAHERHYTRTANYLNITQPSLTHAIQQLEEELGVQLFEKNGRKNELTQYGADFLHSVEHALSILDHGIENIKRHAKGEGVVRLGFLRAVGVSFIPKLVSEYLHQKSDYHAEFTFHTEKTPELLEGLKKRKYDIVFCSKPVGNDYTSVPVGRQDLVLIVPENHSLAVKQEISLEETADEPYIYFDRSTGLRPVIDTLFETANIQPKVAYETDEDQVIAGLVAAGFGIAVVPYMEMLLKLDVKILPIVKPTVERSIYMVSDNQTYMTPAAEMFWNYVLALSPFTT